MIRQYSACRVLAASATRANYLFWTLLLWMLALATTDRAFAQTTTVEFNIPAQTVPAALNDFARQARVQLFFITDGFEDVQANAVVGTYDRQEALTRLLAGTGLQASLSPNSGVKIGPVSTSMNSLVVGSQLLAVAGAVAAADTTGGGYPGEQSNEDARPSGQDTERDDAEEAPRPVEEILVTGSRIRGVENDATPVYVFDREDIERSGASTIEELVDTLPQNFGAGATQDSFTDFGDSGVGNFAAGSSINLRGLGPSSTLVLLNGRRITSGGFDGQFVDVSTIPLNAIERVEVLTDGASAIYGADAIGGVVNFRLRGDYEGAETRFRIGRVTDGNSEEYQFGQVFGKSWDTGNALVTLDYYKRTKLESSEREFAADSDLRRFGGDNFSTPGGNPANILAGGQIFAIPTGQDGTSLTAADFVAGTQNFNNRREGWDFLPEQERYGLFVNFSQALTERIDLFADARYTQRESTLQNAQGVRDLVVAGGATGNPFFVDPTGTGLVTVTVSNYAFTDDLGSVLINGEVESYGGTLGATFQLGRSWEAELAGTFSRQEIDSLSSNQLNEIALAAALAGTTPDTAFNPFGDGSNTNAAVIDTLRTGGDSDNSESELWSVNLNVDGTLWDISGGSVKVATGVEYREESNKNSQTTGARFEASIFVPGLDRDREVVAAYGELFVPLVGEANGRPGLERLEISAAVRYEDFSDFGNDTNPKVSLLWSPLKSVSLRSTWGTSFKAPLLRDLSTTGATNGFIVFPSFFGLPTDTIFLLGGNPDLQPEEATTWTAGFDIAPKGVPGLNIGLTYFSIEFEGRIQQPTTNIFDAFLPEFASILNDTPTQAQITAIASDSLYMDFFGFSAADLISGAVTVGAIVDYRLNNIAESEVTGLDLHLSYGFDSALGQFELGLNGSYLLDFKEQFIASSPFVEMVDTLRNPVDLRLRGSVSWSRGGGWAASAFVNYVDNYTDDVSTPTRAIDSWTTVDVQVSYDTSDRSASRWGDNIKVALSVRNLFDEDPPFANTSGGLAYDSANANGEGRFVSLEVTKAW